MRKDTMLVVFGAVLILVPFAGIPSTWKTAITALLGLFVVFVSLSLRHYLTRVSERLSKVSPTRAGAAFVEHTPQPEAARPAPKAIYTAHPQRVTLAKRASAVSTAYEQHMETARQRRRAVVVSS